MILAVETSCDDTCAAVLDGDVLRASVVSSQDGFHARYGGVVPEVASRHHLELVNQVVAAAMEQAGAPPGSISRVAVTVKPGLIGALMVGVATAKALAYAWGTELVGVDHMDGHIAANFLPPEPMEPPFVCLVASGGHTALMDVRAAGSYTVLGRTLDDAAGEALDKGARLLGLDYPGGAQMDLLASGGDSGRYDFPVGLDQPGNLDFSFSGVKTALYYFLRDRGGERLDYDRADIAASYQRAVVTALVRKSIAAAQAAGHGRLCLSGGVSANSQLRRRLADVCGREGITLRVPPPELCTDNAAMIASAARFREPLPPAEALALGARASGSPS